MLQVSNLTKHFGLTPVVNNINFHLNKGDVVGFLGLNGAGKSTTLKMLSTLLSPTSGSVEYYEKPIESDIKNYRQNLGYLPEVSPIHPELTTREYLRYAGSIRGLDKKLLNERLEYVIAACALEQVQNKLCSNLSKGFLQRVGIAQAIIHKPSVLLLDEPTNGLDPEQMKRMRELIFSLKEHSAVLFSTHLFQEVTMLCNRVIVIHRGEVLLEKKLEDTSTEELEDFFLGVVKGAAS